MRELVLASEKVSYALSVPMIGQVRPPKQHICLIAHSTQRAGIQDGESANADTPSEDQKFLNAEDMVVERQPCPVLPGEAAHGGSMSLM